MATRRPPTTVYILAPDGYVAATRFRGRLARALAPLTGSGTRVRLLRPHSEAAIARVLGHARNAHAKRFDASPFEYGVEQVQTASEQALATSLQARTAVNLALVVLVVPGVVGHSPYHSPIDFPVRRLVQARRPDLLVPVILGGPAPSARSASIGERLLAAAATRDWRDSGWSDSAFGELAAALAVALSLPLAPEIAPGADRAASLDVVRVAADGSGDCFRLAEGLALARRGGRVEVSPGTYLESPRISRSVHLRGVGNRDSIRVVGSYHALSTAPEATAGRSDGGSARAMRATIENLTLETTGSYGTTVSLGWGQVKMQDCTLEASRGGTVSSFSTDHGFRSSVRLSNCILKVGTVGAATGNGRFRFTDCVFLGTGARGQQGLVAHGPGSVQRCTFVDLEWPVEANAMSARLDMRSSLVVGGTVAVQCNCKADVELRRVRVVGAVWGIQAFGEANLQMSGCRIESTTSGDLVVKGSAHSVGWDNTYEGSGGPAIWVAGDADCLIANSRVEGAKWGAVVQDEARLELTGSRILDAEFYAAGAAGKASLIARANLLQGHNNGFQFVEHSAGEIAENGITDSREYGIGVWSDGIVSIRGNKIGYAGKERGFIAREAVNVIFERDET